jgi:cell division transport system permease protein
VRTSFFFSEALGSLRRNWVMTMAAILTVFISMCILGVALVTDRNLNQGATSLKNRILIKVFISDNATPEQVTALQQKIDSMPEIKKAVYISKDQALEAFRKMMGSQANEILSALPNNPLPADYDVYVKNSDQVESVAQQFVGNPAVDDAKPGSGLHDSVGYAKKTVRRMLGIINLIEKGMWVATSVFGVAAILLISTTVRLSIFARRREIEIMRLVGATNWFIRWPFVLEGFMTGLVGSVLAGVSIYAFNWTVFKWIKSTELSYLAVKIYPPWFQSGHWPLGLMPSLALLGALLGSLGGGFALRRYLKV